MEGGTERMEGREREKENGRGKEGKREKGEHRRGWKKIHTMLLWLSDWKFALFMSFSGVPQEPSNLFSETIMAQISSCG